MKKIVLCFKYIKISNKQLQSLTEKLKLRVSKNSRKIRKRRQIGNWRSELSILSHSGLNSDNIKLNIKEKIIFHKCRLTNPRAVLQFTEELKQKIQAKPQKKSQEIKKKG
jgi:hypothetical protein